MRNSYTLSDDGTTVTIWLKRKNGDQIPCLIDAADLPKLQALKTTWCAQWDEDMNSFYVKRNLRVNGKKTGIYMHRFLMDAPKGLKVDHWNHDTTDNRRSNLRVVTNRANIMNRRGAQRNSRTGHRGIHPYLTTGKFRLQLTIDGQRKDIGSFPAIEDAIAARNQHPGYEALKRSK
jgi:hypothetical protein